MTPTEHALWQAIEADPSDRLRRDVLADFYRENGRGDEADAVQATAENIPRAFYDAKQWSWQITSGAAVRDGSGIDDPVWDRLANASNKIWTYWKDYPTFRAAMLDLIRAWCVVHREGVKA